MFLDDPEPLKDSTHDDRDNDKGIKNGILIEAGTVSNFSSIDTFKTFHSEGLWSEFKVLDRLMYKYHNQQRRNVHFRRLNLLRRRLQRISKMERWVTWAVIDGNESDIGKKLFGVELISELITSARRDCMEAYEALHALLLDVIYLPFALIASACVAKIFVQLDKLSRIVRAVRLDLHSQPQEIRPVTVHSEEQPRMRRSFREKREAGWEHGTGEGKKRKYNKKMKRPRNQDEIDDIFT
jgi:hypothetical protein